MAGNSIIAMSAIFEFFRDPKIIRKGENSVASGFVKNVIYDDDLQVIRGGVQASMKQKIYNVEIFLSNGDIERATCNCPKGLDVCHHMASLTIFAHRNLSVTNKACQWSKVKRITEDSILTAEKCFASTSKTFSPLLQNISEKSVQQFEADLKACGPTGLGWLLSPEPKIYEEMVVIDIEQLIFSEDYAKHDNKTLFLKEKLALTRDKITEIEKLTIGQTNNPTWHIVRKHRLTASNFGQVLKACRRNRFPPSLFQRITGDTNLGGIKQIQWGRSNESTAVEMFERKNNIKIINSGIWLHDSGFLGASPDGIVDDDTLIEIKCPFKYKDSLFCESLLGSKDYIVSFDGQKFVLNIDHDYYDQIQGQMHICEKKICVLILWSTKDYIEIKVEKNIAWQKNLEILENFYLNKYIEHMLN